MANIKKLLLAIGVVFICFTVTVPPTPATNNFPTRTRKEMIYNIWCRQDALYWGALVGEDMEVRIAIGMYDMADGGGPTLHAQPQVKILTTWYFFKMEPYRDDKSHMKQERLIIISMPKKAGHTWKKMYHMTWTEFALVQNTWMIQKNGKNLDSPKYKKDWSRRMNQMIKIYRKGIK